ncbi:MAG: cation:proton antiporter [Alphaproteobacteria bacterium]
MAVVLAVVFGVLANRLRLPPLVGYLIAGIAIGPFTPGFVADAHIAGQLAEIGVILLMFGVGLHFSAADLRAVRGIAVPGAIGQIAVATAIGIGLAMAWGWSFGAGLVFGLTLSVASTVVLLRALEERNALDTANGRIAVGWLIVEDLAMVLALVLLPALAGALGGKPPAGAPAPDGDLLLTVAITLGKVIAFVGLALGLGPRVVPWLLAQVARTGSREMFTLTVLGIALGIAYGSSALFGVSFALGAFFAGVVLSESELSHRAAADSLPLQDAFAVLFFVSVGMLFDPSIIVRQPLEVIAVLALILLGKSLVALAIVLALGFPLATGLTVAASLAQIGEFSFILAGLGITYGLLSPTGRDLILAGAILSIVLNPMMFAAVDALLAKYRARLGLMARHDPDRSKRLTALETELQEVQQRMEAARAVAALKIEDLVEKIPMFAALDPAERARLLNLFKPASAVPGQRLIRVGDRADAAFFISSGTVEVNVGGKRIQLGAGDLFGEMALLSGARRSADVTALDYCQLLKLERRDFRRFIEKYPALRAQLDAMAAQRSEMNRRATEPDPAA